MVSVHDDGDARSAMAELAVDTALRAEKAREGNGAMSAFGQALALFWSADTRCGAFGRACAPCGEKLLRRSAMTVTDRFLKTAIQCLMTMTDSAISSCQHGSTNDPLQKLCT